MPRIPLVEDLTKGPVPAGSPLLVEYDPASQWYNASLTIAAGWMQTGGRIAYNVSTRPPDNIRSQLCSLELNVEELERSEKLEFYDWYGLTLGRKPKELEWGPSSLKAADLSVEVFGSRPLTLEEARAQGFGPDFLIIWDDASFLERFNDTKSWTELLITRYIAKKLTLSRTNISLRTFAPRLTVTKSPPMWELMSNGYLVPTQFPCGFRVCDFLCI